MRDTLATNRDGGTCRQPYDTIVNNAALYVCARFLQIAGVCNFNRKIAVAAALCLLKTAEPGFGI